MNRDHFLRPIEGRDAPPWPCPKCRAGTLHVDESTIQFQETPHSLELRRGGYEDAPAEIATLVLRCSNRSCGEFFRLLGDREYKQVEADSGELYWEPTTTPLFIHPGLEFFPPPPRCPKTVQEELKAACYLYWADQSAAGNRLRTAVEVLLTHLKIRRYSRKKGKKRLPLTLCQRIEILQASRPDIADPLHATRWLGNAASHTEGLKHADVLDGAEIIESVLDKLYTRTAERLGKVAREITRTKRPRSRRRPRRSRGSII